MAKLKLMGAFMRRAIALIFLMIPACEGAKSPEEAAGASVVQVTDGFRFGGGVIITDQHVLSQAAMVRNVEDASVVDSTGKGSRARVTGRNMELNSAMLFIEAGSLPKVKIGDSTTVVEGSPVATQLFDAQGKPTLKTGTFKGWRYSEGRAYMETDLDTPETNAGAGVIGADGKLIGLQSFKMGSKLTYVLPIEYLTNGPKALTASALGEKKDNPGFVAKRAEAEKHTEALPTPLTYDNLSYEFAFSKTALVGVVRMLDKKDAPVHGQPLKWKFDAIDEAQTKKILGEGTLDATNVKWATSPEALAEVTKSMTDSYGEAWVKENLAPYEFGELRWRLPFAPICGKVTDKEVHTLVLTLADGRATQAMSFNDMVNICAAQEEGEGATMEKDWGFTGEPATAPKAPKAAPTKKRKRGR